MFANTLFRIFETVLAWVVVPVQIVTTFVLGLLVSLTFGLLLLPISLVYIVLLWAPLIACSWVCSKFELLRNPVGVVLLPLALLANTYVCLMPSMGELESRAAKLLFTRSWPFSWEFFRFQTGRMDIEADEAEPLRRVLARAVPTRDFLSQRVVQRLALREPLDADV